MFILMGTLASKAGLAQDLFDLANRFLRRLPGGPAIAGIAGCAGFAAVTGSSIATITSVRGTAMGEMRRHGYDAALAAGAIAAAGTLGILIPPSIGIVLLGVVTGTSIGASLIAGIVPGILTAIAYAGVVLVRTTRRPALAGGPTGPGYGATTPPDRPPLTLAQFSRLGKVVLISRSCSAAPSPGGTRSRGRPGSALRPRC
jgi:TRAP-type C4-dicarboxylate transport system permease large subunit